VAVVGVVNIRYELRSQVDRTLVDQARSLAERPDVVAGAPESTASVLASGTGPEGSPSARSSSGDGRAGPPRPDTDGDDDHHGAAPFAEVPVRIIDDSGTVVQGSSFGSELAPDARDVAVATGASGPTRRDRYADGEHFRLATVPVGNGLALQTLRSMADVDGTVRNTTFAFTLIGLAGVAVAAALGILVARSALVPVARLSRAVDGVASRLDLRATVPETGGAELSRLGRSFNTALAALDASRRQQQRLVQDAAHELRTPWTSLRTNVEVLQQLERLAPEERASLLADLSAQLEELSRLVADLGMLSRHDSAETETPTEVRFDRVAAAAVERARPRLPAGPASRSGSSRVWSWPSPTCSSGRC
jgi:signal transduction histidine kinase